MCQTLSFNGAKAWFIITLCFALNIIATKPLIGDGRCCVICGGTKTCGCAIEDDCGSCCVPPCCLDGGSGWGDTLPSKEEKPIAIKLSVGKGNPQKYLVTRGGSLQLEDQSSGDSYVIHASWEGGEPKEISLDIKKIYPFFGIEFSRELQSVKLKTGPVAAPIRIGPIAILGVGNEN